MGDQSKEQLPSGDWFYGSSTGCNLSIACEEGEQVVKIKGEIDLGSAPKVYSLLWQAAKEGSSPLIINLEEVEFMDSSGLQVLLRLREKLQSKSKGISILLVNPKPQIRKLFQLTGFDKLFSFFTDNQQAISFLKYKKSKEE
jgi:anti-sigma B factor antagonist